MLINFGTYSVRMKIYNYKDLNQDENYKDFNFYLYQSVFYILFIPILPIEKFWKIKNSKQMKMYLLMPQ